MYLSLVTLAMIDAAPTILYIESALGQTVNVTVGKISDRRACH